MFQSSDLIDDDRMPLRESPLSISIMRISNRVIQETGNERTLPESCPQRRTCFPSCSNDPIASASAVAKSIPVSLSSEAIRFDM